MDSKKIDGKQLLEIAQQIFPGKQIGPNELDYTLSMIDPLLYCLKRFHVKGHPLSFSVPNYDVSKASAHRNWQMEPIREITNIDNKKVVVQKARQLGFSEISLMSLIFMMDAYSGLNLKYLYLFPSFRQMQGFYKSRIMPQLDSNYFRNLLNQHDLSMEQMSLRNSTAFFRSGSASRIVEGIDVDVIMFDEYERYAGTSAVDSALRSSDSDNKYGLARFWSTPSVPDFGISKEYEMSDQRQWMIRCHSCGLWQALNFKKNIKVVDKSLIRMETKEALPGACQYVCSKCGANIESDRWYSGRWVAKYPNQQRAVGFKISQMDAVWITADDIYTKYLSMNSRQEFYDYILGEPYENVQQQMYDTDILNHRDESFKAPVNFFDKSKFSRLTIGVDFGQHFHTMSILGMKPNGIWELANIIKIQNSNDTGQIEEDLRQILSLLTQYEPDLICMDIGYNGNYVQKIQQLFPDNAWGMKVRPAKSNGDPNAHWSEANKTVLIDKLTQNKILISNIKAGRILFWHDVNKKLQMFIKHAKNVVIRQELNEKTNETEERISRRGPDHSFQALVYACVGMQRICDVLRDDSSSVVVDSLDGNEDANQMKNIWQG